MHALHLDTEDYYSARSYITIQMKLDCDLMTLADDIQITEFDFTIEPPTTSDLSPDQPPSNTLAWSNDGTSFTSHDIWYWLGSTKAYVLDPQVVSPYTFSCSLTSLAVDESIDVMIDGMSFDTAADLTG